MAMHKEYGTSSGHCKDCCNYITGKHRDKTYSKCIAYGISHSVATDWSYKHAACGLLNKNIEKEDLKPLIDVLRHRKNKNIENEIMDGQIALMDIL